MGKTPGRPKRGQLVDMSTIPDADPFYEPPARDECEECEYPWTLAADHQLRCRWWLWQEAYKVDFAIVQVTRAGGKWCQVARIDCDHGVVHRHRLRRQNPDDTVGVRDELMPIPYQRGWETVDKYYDDALKLMQDSWRENLRIWGGDRE